MKITKDLVFKCNHPKPPFLPYFTFLHAPSLEMAIILYRKVYGKEVEEIEQVTDLEVLISMERGDKNVHYSVTQKMMAPINNLIGSNGINNEPKS